MLNLYYTTEHMVFVCDPACQHSSYDYETTTVAGVTESVDRKTGRHKFQQISLSDLVSQYV